MPCMSAGSAPSAGRPGRVEVQRERRGGARPLQLEVRGRRDDDEPRRASPRAACRAAGEGEGRLAGAGRGHGQEVGAGAARNRSRAAFCQGRRRTVRVMTGVRRANPSVTRRRQRRVAAGASTAPLPSLVGEGSGAVRESPTACLRQVVVRVRHLERAIREATEQVAVLVAEVGHDVVALRLDVGARPRLVRNGRAGRRGGDGRAAERRVVEVARVRADWRLGEQAVGVAAVGRCRPAWPSDSRRRSRERSSRSTSRCRCPAARQPSRSPGWRSSRRAASRRVR